MNAERRGESGPTRHAQPADVPRQGRTPRPQLVGTAGIGLLLLLWALPAGALDPVPLSSDPSRRVADILDQIRARYVEPIDERKLVSDAVNGVLRGLDAYSKYLEPDAFRRMQEESRGRYGGVGIELRMLDGAPRVQAVFDESPAQHGGVQAGDRILRIDGAEVAKLALSELVQRMRGAPGSQVSLELQREGASQPIVVTLTRAQIQAQSVRARLVAPGVLYLRVSGFQEQTPQMLAAALDRQWKNSEGGLTGIVLDLRDNPGGLITAAVGVSAAFLPEDATVVTADGAGQDSTLRRSARRQDYLRGRANDYLARLPAETKSLPLVVLVNRHSASASEIVAGALQDHKRALILGTQTHGKGSVQQLIPFDDGSGLKITTSYYYTPNGHKVQGKGITPDVVIEAQAGPARVTDAAPALPATDAGSAGLDATASLGCVAPAAPSDAEEKDCQLEEALRRLTAMSIARESQ
jgi:carboxyl-terminal processing protease